MTDSLHSGCLPMRLVDNCYYDNSQPGSLTERVQAPTDCDIIVLPRRVCVRRTRDADVFRNWMEELLAGAQPGRRRGGKMTDSSLLPLSSPLFTSPPTCEVCLLCRISLKQCLDSCLCLHWRCVHLCQLAALSLGSLVLRCVLGYSLRPVDL